MGYELQKADGDEVSPEHNEAKVKRSEAQAKKQKAKDKQKRKLAKEGLDDAAAPRKRKPERQGAKSEKLVGKRIAVKWASKGGKNFIMTAGKSGPSEFYSGKVMAYKPVRNRYKVIFDDQPKKRYTVNLSDPKSKDFVPPDNWKRI